MVKSAKDNTNRKPTTFTMQRERLSLSGPVSGRRRPGLVSILRTLKADLLAPPHMKIQPRFDDLNALLDVDRTGQHVGGVGHQHAAIAELIVVVFQSGRPHVRECPFDPAARSPPEAQIEAFEIERGAGESSRNAVAVAGPGDAALDVKQPTVNRISQTCGHTGNQVHSPGDRRCFARKSQWQSNARAASQGGPRGGTLGAD